ncbi:energy-coupling factor transporter ATPase [Paenibacillus oralis]|uniref:Energy-coupling factor transporter ATP-binding protein EcfA2 n=1 Tax=Paenibacillus oralis TaxID=2490856 RepID=A0A3P3U255_9BACL|nr:energy-coupling factor transporter ATPase [Paenibacillus oralis]RRJ63719.1 energy-coupling factor transporter ATPase [Paenibacillus oralis]
MAIHFEQVSFAYDDRSLWRHSALENVTLHVARGAFAAIAGASGSGKSTLMQLFNGLLKPTAGKVRVLDVTLQAGEKASGMRELRRRVGLVFQFPEQQLFEDTVEKDLCFGPLNFGCPAAEARERASRALALVGLDDSFLARNPFHLSGGQMRKVAIASVLAMEPDVIALDEPTATLDPQSRAELAGMLSRLHREQGKTLIVVTHRMEEMLPYAERWIVMNEGRIAFQGTPGELVREAVRLEAEGLKLPDSIHCWRAVSARFGLEAEEPCLTAEALAERLARLMPRTQPAVAGNAVMNKAGGVPENAAVPSVMPGNTAELPAVLPAVPGTESQRPVPAAAVLGLGPEAVKAKSVLEEKTVQAAAAGRPGTEQAVFAVRGAAREGGG